MSEQMSVDNNVNKIDNKAPQTNEQQQSEEGNDLKNENSGRNFGKKLKRLMGMNPDKTAGDFLKKLLKLEDEPEGAPKQFYLESERGGYKWVREVKEQGGKVRLEQMGRVAEDGEVLEAKAGLPEAEKIKNPTAYRDDGGFKVGFFSGTGNEHDDILTNLQILKEQNQLSNRNARDIIIPHTDNKTGEPKYYVLNPDGNDFEDISAIDFLDPDRVIAKNYPLSEKTIAERRNNAANNLYGHEEFDKLTNEQKQMVDNVVEGKPPNPTDAADQFLNQQRSKFALDKKTIMFAGIASVNAFKAGRDALIGSYPTAIGYGLISALAAGTAVYNEYNIRKDYKAEQQRARAVIQEAENAI